MPQHREVRLLPWSPEELFDLVADVRAYPQFLPWVNAIRVRSEEPGRMVADMVVGFRLFHETFTSSVTFDRPRLVHVDYVSGPLRTLANDWRFEPDGNGGTRLDFHVDFEFRSRLLERLAGAFFSEAFLRMVNSFERRAASIYGSRGNSSRSASTVASRRISSRSPSAPK